MADPRLYQTFKCQAAQAARQSTFRNFGNAVGKIGDLQVLNSIGAGKIGEGLRTLASISNTIRTGCGSLPTSIGSTIESGANWVLENTGIASTVVNAVANFNPQIANQAYGQAKQIFQKVQQGHFKTSDIPGALQDLQNLERLGRNIFTPDNVQGGITTLCTTSPYAMDLISRAPKHKFMFVVQVTFNPGYSTALDHLDFAFVVKKSSRLNVKYQSEDVNYYNFRSKVITRTEFEEMSMSFHDDILNDTMGFYNAYLRAMTPVTNLDSNSFFTDPENNGMAFADQGTVNVLNDTKNPIEELLPSNHYTASRGPLVGDIANVIRSIQLYHVYDGGRRANVFYFFNPRITQLNLDELDMSVSNEGTEMSMSFNFDSVYIDAGVDVADLVDGSGNFLPGQTRGAIYPLRYNSTATAMDGAHTSAMATTAAGATQACDPMNDINTSV